jgi:uncharacterized membrane protein YgaE (UPF0421/DUF939 family)
VATVSLRDRVRLVRVGFPLALQAAVAAGIAWYVAHHLLGHVQPFFAPIAAVVVLAVSVGQRLRRAVEIVAGNAVGILLGTALILVIGRGSWQIALVVLLAVLVAMFVGGSAPLIVQAASSGSLVVTVVTPLGDYVLSRFVDAVVGGTVGLAVMALLLPLNPLTVVRRAATPILDALATGLNDVATALETRDGELAAAALDRLRQAEAKLRGFNDAIAAGREISTAAPLRWRSRDALRQYVDSYNHVARALRNTRVLVRRSVAMLNDGETISEALVFAIRELAAAVEELRWGLANATEPVATREHALAAARAAASAYRVGLGFSGTVVVAQIRSTASDLLAATGLAPEVVQRAVRRATAPVPGQ